MAVQSTTRPRHPHPLAAARVVSPAAKAYLVGYVLDILPALLKLIIKYVTTQLRLFRHVSARRREERNLVAEQQQQADGKHRPTETTAAAVTTTSLTSDALLPSLRQLPVLLISIARALVYALGPRGMAFACALATLGTATLDYALQAMLLTSAPANVTNTTTITTASQRNLSRETRIKALCTLAAATISSTAAITVLQRSQIDEAQASARSRRTPIPAGVAKDDIVGSSDAADAKGAPLSSSAAPRGFNPFRRRDKLPSLTSSQPPPPPSHTTITNATPLAPAGHILARLTSLSIPVTPSASGSRSPDQAEAAVAAWSSSSSSGGLTPMAAPGSGTQARAASPVLEKPTARDGARGASSGQEADDDGDGVGGGDGGRRRPAARRLGRPSPTIDLTLFALVRALDALANSSLAPRRAGGGGGGGDRGGSSSSSVKGKGVATFAGRSAAEATAAAATGTSGAAAAAAAARAAAATAAAAAAASRGRGGSVRSRALRLLREQAEGITFVVSCALIMWSWFYAPERLPPTYVKWITNLAAMDERLLLALRSIRTGKPHVWDYGMQPAVPASVDLVGSLSESLGYPYEWGDPSRLPSDASEAREMLQRARRANAGRAEKEEESTPADPLLKRGGEPGYVLAGAAGARGRGEMGGMPCEIVHCGVGGASCSANASLRWLRAFKVCLGIYLPVHLLPRLLFGGPGQLLRHPLEVGGRVLRASARSAAFLSTFIASIWYMVCFTRSLALPRLFPSVSHRFWDRGLGPMLGCWACGLSIWILPRGNRPEMALYVAPRAVYAATEMARPGWLSGGDRGALWAERLLFGLSMGFILVSAKQDPKALRGATSIMSWVYKDGRAPASSSRSPGAVAMAA